MKAKFSGADFKALVDSVTKMPSLGSFAGSELINLEIANGVCKASSFGVILSVSQMAAQGRLNLCGIDERLLLAYSTLSAGAKWIVMETVGKEVKLRNSHGREVVTTLKDGLKHVIDIPKTKAIPVDTLLAQRIGYLSDIAYSDASLPELNCVFLMDDKGIAVNQRCIAVLDLATQFSSPVALPIPIAKVLGTGYSVHVSPQQTIAENGNSAYAMPSPSKAQQGFPLGMVKQFMDAKNTDICTVSGKAFSQIIGDCNACLSALARTDVDLFFTCQDSKAELRADNGSATFKSSIKAASTDTAVVGIPLEEIVKALPFLCTQETVTLAGGSGGETYVQLSDGFLMFPSNKTLLKKK